MELQCAEWPRKEGVNYSDIWAVGFLYCHLYPLLTIQEKIQDLAFFSLSNSYSKMPRSKPLISAQVFCVSCLPNPSQLPLRWFTLKWHHVHITSPNSAVVKTNFKATSGTRGFAQSCGASAQLVVLQDSSKACPSTLHTADQHSLLGMTSQCLGLNLLSPEVCG